jgi:hypothetical protein
MSTDDKERISNFEKGEFQSSNETLKQIIDDILPLFVWGNISILSGLVLVYIMDNVLLLNGKINASERIIDKTVILSLIAATVAELSIIIIAAIKKLK